MTAPHVAAWSRLWPRAGAGPLSSTAAGSPPVLTAVYDDAAGRVALSLSVAPPGAVTVHLQRSVNQVSWTDVRGAQALPVGAAQIFDYEYTAGVLNYYRASYVDASGNPVTPATIISVQINQTAIWLKNPVRPFLNRTIRLVGPLADVSRNSRSGLFDIIGATLPVGVTDLMSGKLTSYAICTETRADVVAVDSMIAVGDVLFFQPPGGSDLETLYGLPGNPSYGIFTENRATRFTTLPLSECAKPDLTLAAVQSTWQTVLNTYATWQDLINAKATWADVLQLVGTAEDVITS